MYSFQNLIKKIRDEAGLTQSEFARALGVSTVLITMIETGKKEVSKKFLITLADRLHVHPASITPFLFIDEAKPVEEHSSIEKRFAKWGEQMQSLLIKNRASLLREYVKD